MSVRRKSIFVSIASLSAGGLSYIMFRKSTYIAVFFSHIEFISVLQDSCSAIPCDFLRYYFPDFAWCLALCCSLQILLYPKKHWAILSAVTALLCGVTLELFQYLNAVIGTADFADVCMYLLAGVAGIIIHMEEKENEKT